MVNRIILSVIFTVSVMRERISLCTRFGAKTYFCINSLELMGSIGLILIALLPVIQIMWTDYSLRSLE